MEGGGYFVVACWVVNWISGRGKRERGIPGARRILWASFEGGMIDCEEKWGMWVVWSGVWGKLGDAIHDTVIRVRRQSLPSRWERRGAQ